MRLRGGAHPPESTGCRYLDLSRSIRVRSVSRLGLQHHQRVDRERAGRPRDDRVEVDLDDRPGRPRAGRRPPRRRPATASTSTPVRAADAAQERRPAQGLGAASTTSSPGRPARAARRRRRAPRRGSRRAPPAPPARTRRRAAPPTISSTPGGGHRLDEQAAQRDAGARGRGHAAPSTAGSIAASSASPSAHAAGVALVGEARRVELERDRAAAEVAPGRDGRRRPRPRATARHGRHGDPGRREPLEALALRQRDRAPAAAARASGSRTVSSRPTARGPRPAPASRAAAGRTRAASARRRSQRGQPRDRRERLDRAP